MSESSDAFVGIFPNYAIVRLEGDKGWGAVDSSKQLTVIDGKDALLKLIDRDPPRVTADLELAKRYALFVDQIENPDDKQVDSYNAIVWKDTLTPDEQVRIDTARGKDSVEPPVAKLSGERVTVFLWVTSRTSLIHRLITVQPDGHYDYYNTKWADDLPLVPTTPKKLTSLDAFRSYCGVPTMPIEQCRLCSHIPVSTSRHVEDDDVSDDRPGEMLDLKTFIDTGDGKILRCPVCKRLYFEETSFGLGYFDYDAYWTRYEVDELFNIKWSVAQRLPNHRVKTVAPGPSPDHVKVQLEDIEGWFTLDTNNQLTPPEPPPPPPVQLPPPPVAPIAVERPFESLDAFRTHCGEPAMPLEQCPICSKIPERCGKDDDHIPREIEQLVDLFESDIRRCPTCHRLYLYESMHFGNDIYTGNDSTWSLKRFSVDDLFDQPYCVKQRVPALNVTWVVRERYFEKHALVQIERSWAALSNTNELVMLDGHDAIVKLIESDKPRDPTWKCHITYNEAVVDRYARVLDDIENPDDLRFQPAPFASRLEKPTERTWDGRVIVRFWVRAQNRNFLRIMIVDSDGHYERREAAAPPTYFASLDAFRAFCGEPTMPLEQCPVCSKTPEHDGGESTCPPPEADRFPPFIGDAVRQCRDCRRLYMYSSFSGGNDIYRGNETTWSLDRISVDELFDSKWGVESRLPDLDVSFLGDRFFPNHVLVRFGSRAWGALDHNNKLVVLDNHYVIEQLIDSDPPHVTSDLELAKRYALFVDERESPDDHRPNSFEWIRWTDSQSAEEQQRVAAAKAATGHDMSPVAERDGDRVVVRLWATTQDKRLIRRVLTVMPNGHVTREQVVVAENLPIRDGLPVY